MIAKSIAYVRDPLPIGIVTPCRFTRGALFRKGASSPNETNELFRLSWNESFRSLVKLSELAVFH